MLSQARAATMRGILLVAFILSPTVATAAFGGDVGWPQFRGPHRNGISETWGLATNWPEDGPPVLWRQPTGEGFSELTIVDGRLFVLLAHEESEIIVALDDTSGEELWRKTLGPRFPEQFGDGPRATPVIHDGILYALTSLGKLHALKAKNGRRLWSVDFVEEFGSQVPRRGFSASPLVVGSFVLAEAGGSDGRAFVALDRKRGHVHWTAENGSAGYSSGITATLGGVEQIVFARTTAHEIVSLLPTGEVYWRHPWEAGPIGSPLFVPPDRIFASASQDTGAILMRKFENRDTIGAILLEIGGANDSPEIREIWNSRAMKNHFSSSVLIDDHIYGFDNSTLRCISAATGERIWARRGLGKGTLIAADDMLYVLSDKGLLLMVEATPVEYREKRSFQAMTGRAWTGPALAGRRLYLRDQDEIACIDLRTAAERSVSHAGDSIN